MFSVALNHATECDTSTLLVSKMELDFVTIMSSRTLRATNWKACGLLELSSTSVVFCVTQLKCSSSAGSGMQPLKRCLLSLDTVQIFWELKCSWWPVKLPPPDLDGVLGVLR